MPPDQSQPSRRLQRIASRLKFLVSQVIQNELSDPRIGFVTVLAVEPTEDMKEAKVYLSFLGNQGERSKTEHALASARGFIQREVGKNLKTRNTPHLRFIFDDTRDKVARIEALIDETAQRDRESKMTKLSGSKVDDEFDEDEFEADLDSDGDDGEPEDGNLEEFEHEDTEDDKDGDEDEDEDEDFDAYLDEDLDEDLDDDLEDVDDEDMDADFDEDSDDEEGSAGEFEDDYEEAEEYDDEEV